MDTNNQTVDPTALSLSRAIRNAEGGDYSNTSGDNGTSAGAYQWNNGKLPLKKGEIPANFKSGASQFGLNPDDFSQTNQDHVAYSQIKHDLDSGLTQSQIAAKWNSGLTHGWENHKGTTTINGKTISYDTPAYVAKVQKYYEGNQNDSSTQTNTNTTSGKKGLTFDDIPQGNTTTQPNTPTDTTAPGHVIEDIGKGDYGAAIQSGIRGFGSLLTGGGTEDLGNSLSGSVARAGEKIKGVLGGKDNSAFIPKNTDEETTKGISGGAKVAGVIGGLASLGTGAGLLNASRGNILKTVASRESFPIAKEVFLNLDKRQQLNELGLIFKDAGEGDAIEIAKAMKYLKPQASQINKLLKGGISLAGKAALLKIFGDTVGGLIHKSISK